MEKHVYSLGAQVFRFFFSLTFMQSTLQQLPRFTLKIKIIVKLQQRVEPKVQGLISNAALRATKTHTMALQFTVTRLTFGCR